MKLTVQLKLLPDKEQAATLLATIERANSAANAASRIAWERSTFGQFALHKLAYREIRGRFGLAAQMAVRVIGKVADAYKPDRTRERSFRSHGSIAYDARILKYGAESVSIWTLRGRQRISFLCGEHQRKLISRINGESDLVYRDSKWYLFATAELQEPPEGQVVDWIGVDLGIVNLAVDSDGAVYSGASVDKNRRVFAHRRRNLQRKGTRSARRKLQSIRRKQARYQADTNHIISKRVVAIAKGTARGIAVEDLGGIRQRTTVRRRQRARHANWAFFQLRSFIEYKALQDGVPVVAVDPRNTSRTCPACGCIDKANRPAQDRFLCTSCGLAGLPDAFAARVIAARARAAVMLPMVAQWEHGVEAVAASRLL